MREGTASRTARNVAARRLEFARIEAAYGDPAADDALTSDVADGETPEHNRMHEYLRARTAFFDRVVVTALDRGVSQVVIGGAGYDGRAFRYAKPGVRWFEVDHPATQADKRERIARLGLDAAHIAFIAADFTADPVAARLREAGLDQARPALFLFEGVAVYLERPVIERVLAEFRAVTAPGALLAISVSTGAASSTRAAFERRVAELGEPARSMLNPAETAVLLSAAGWQVSPASGRQESAGLLLARAADPERARVPPAAAQEQARAVDPERARATPAAGQEQAHATPAVDTERVPATPSRPQSPAAPPRPGVALRRAGQAPEALPLSALLSQALVAFTIEADNEAEHRIPHRTTDHGTSAHGTSGHEAPAARGPWLTSLLMWANCLRHLPDDGITIAELRGRARTGTNLDGMRRWGYVTFTPPPGRGGQPRQDAVIAPTAWGMVSRDAWPEVAAVVESRWRDRFGDAGATGLRDALAAVVARLDPTLPDCLPILGYGLVSPVDPDQAGFPPSTVPAADLPLWALLSRTLLAFAAQYEAEPGPSIAIGANVLRVLTESGVRGKDIGVLAGVSEESVAMALGVLRKSGLVTEGPDPAGSRFRVVGLTPRGALARDDYPARAADVERDWRTRYGDDLVAALRLALSPLVAGDPPPLFAGLEPHPDNWRAAVRRAATLPHYPMTLHRGGYPDGS
jgi:methyltransferase (TIGR00027 family)